MPEPVQSTGVYIAAKHLWMAAVGGVAVLWATLKFILQSKLTQIKEHEDRIQVMERDYVRRVDLDAACADIKSAFDTHAMAVSVKITRTHDRIDELYTIIPKRSSD